MEWKISNAPVPYEEAIAFMEERVRRIHEGEADECVWLLEHPPLYTAGTSASAADLLNARFPVYHTGRGGQYTYHGPGQRIAYIMLNLQRRGQDVRRYVQMLETWLIHVLADVGVTGAIREGRVGVWVDLPVKNKKSLHMEAKIAAIGVRVRKWITYHGVSLNVCPDLSHYDGIIPCGVREHGVTSLAALGITKSAAEIDRLMQKHFGELFGRI